MIPKLIKIFKSFSRNEQVVFSVSFLIFIITFIFFSVHLINEKTIRIPVAGGEYREGIIGQPVFINPILIGNNEADRDLVQILFSNVLDLADKYKVSPDGKTWNIRLKDDIFWDDGQPITSDDIIFTVETIEDPDSRSILFPLWQGVIVERVSERELKFALTTPYAFFENNLKELRPVPKHIFGDLPPANLRLSSYNLEPVGSGPFKYRSLEKKKDGFITEYVLERNNKYFGKKPYLNKFYLKLYKEKRDLINAMNSGVIDGVAGLAFEELGEINIGHQAYNLKMPRYYAIFFNQYANPILKDNNVRLALNYAVDKKKIIKKVFGDYAVLINGPLAPGMEGYSPDDTKQEEFSLDKAKEILDMSGWVMSEEGIREKTAVTSEENKIKESKIRLEFKMIAPKTQFLIDAANLIADDWSKIGAKLNLDVNSGADISADIIKNRNYEMIIFGNIIGNNSDLYSFWYSSEKFYPGLNLAIYDNKSADSLIESIRKNLNKDSRTKDIRSLSSLISQDLPAIFLFSPDYIYITKNWLNGFKENYISTPSDRFQDIENWYIKTVRVFK